MKLYVTNLTTCHILPIQNNYFVPYYYVVEKRTTLTEICRGFPQYQYV
jgi:hypothetical protein